MKRNLIIVSFLMLLPFSAQAQETQNEGPSVRDLQAMSNISTPSTCRVRGTAYSDANVIQISGSYEKTFYKASHREVSERYKMDLLPELETYFMPNSLQAAVDLNGLQGFYYMYGTKKPKRLWSVAIVAQGRKGKFITVGNQTFDRQKPASFSCGEATPEIGAVLDLLNEKVQQRLAPR